MTTEERRFVVGDDGSEEAAGAARWAAHAAAAAGATLRLVNVAHVPVVAGLGWRVDATYEAARLLHALERAAHEVEERRSRELRDAHPGLHVETAVVTGDPREVLVRESETADLLVVGSRGRGALQALLLGSVGAHAARHATCPTVVFREPQPHARGVLVESRADADPRVLGLARSYAGLLGEPLSVVRPPGDADELVAASHDARLVVVERHRRTGLLNDRSVSVAEHCSCPVVVVPSREP